VSSLSALDLDGRLEPDALGSWDDELDILDRDDHDASSERPDPNEERSRAVGIVLMPDRLHVPMGAAGEFDPMALAMRRPVAAVERSRLVLEQAGEAVRSLFVTVFMYRTSLGRFENRHPAPNEPHR
jgi:hypothetical protein